MLSFMTPESLILILCLTALAAFIIDRFKKLPKSVFVFFAVAVVSAVCWSILNSDRGETPARDFEETSSSQAPLVFTEAVKDIVFAPGETRVALPLLVSGKREFDCVRFVFTEVDSNVSEQGFLEKVRFSLLFPDGTLVPASSFIFDDGEASAFPSNFGLKAFFRGSDSASGSVRCIVENGFPVPLKVSEIFVASRALSAGGNDNGEGAQQ